MTSCELDKKQATKPKFVAQSWPPLYFLQHLSSTCNKCFCCTGQVTFDRTRWKQETSTKTCNETMLKTFVSRISPPLHSTTVSLETKPFSFVCWSQQTLSSKTTRKWPLLDAVTFSTPDPVSKKYWRNPSNNIPKRTCGLGAGWYQDEHTCSFSTYRIEYSSKKCKVIIS